MNASMEQQWYATPQQIPYSMDNQWMLTTNEEPMSQGNATSGLSEKKDILTAEEKDTRTLKAGVNQKIYALVQAACKRQEEVWSQGKDVVDMDLQEIVLLELECSQDVTQDQLWDVEDNVGSQENIRKSLRRAKRRRRRRRKNQRKNSEDPIQLSDNESDWDVQLALASLRLRYTDSMIALKRLEYRQGNVGILASAVHNEWAKTYAHLLGLHVYMSCLGIKKLKHLLQDIPGIVVIGVGGSTRFTTEEHYWQCCHFTELPDGGRHRTSSEDTAQSFSTQRSSPSISTSPPPQERQQIVAVPSRGQTDSSPIAAAVLIQSLGRILTRAVDLRCKAQYLLARQLVTSSMDLGPFTFTVCAAIEAALKSKEKEGSEERERTFCRTSSTVDSRPKSLVEASRVSAAFARRNGILGVPMADVSRVFFRMTKFPIEPLLFPLDCFGNPLEFLYSVPGIFIDCVNGNEDPAGTIASLGGEKTFLFSSDIIWKIITDPNSLLEDQQGDASYLE